MYNASRAVAFIRMPNMAAAHFAGTLHVLLTALIYTLLRAVVVVSYTDVETIVVLGSRDLAKCRTSR